MVCCLSVGGEYCETFHDETVATFTGWYDVAHSAAQETLLQLALLKLGPISVKKKDVQT